MFSNQTVRSNICGSRHDRLLRRSGNTQSPDQREAAQLMAALPGPAGACQAEISAGVCRHPAPTSTSRTVHSRAALTRVPVTRKGELLELPEGQTRTRDVFGGFSDTAARPGHVARVCQRRDRSTNPKAPPSGLLARRPRPLRCGFSRRANWCTTAFSYHMTPGAFILESGAARGRLHGVPGR